MYFVFRFLEDLLEGNMEGLGQVRSKFTALVEPSFLESQKMQGNRG